MSRTRSAVDAWESLLRAQHLIMTKFTADASIWHGITVREYDVLYQLSKHDMKQTELTRRLLIPQPSLSRLIDRLVDKGWIEREVDIHDRRITRLRLTESGEQMQRKVGKAHTLAVADVMLTGLTSEECDTLKHLTDKLVQPQCGADGNLAQ